MMRRLLFVYILLVPATALGGGLGRPNLFGALGQGIGGAGFAGVANPATIYYNPAGMMLMTRTEAAGGVALVLPYRTHERAEFTDPLVDTVPTGYTLEQNEFGITPAPSLGVVSRFAKKGGQDPLPAAFGLAFYNSYGGALSWDKNDDSLSPGMLSTSNILLEVVPAVAYQLTPELALGVGVRIGFGISSTESDASIGDVWKGLLRPSELSGFGLAIGTNLGATYQALNWLRIGVTYGSPMTTSMDGDGVTDPGTPQETNDLMNLTMNWPQYAALGLAFAASPSLEIYAGVRWVDWSSFESLIIDWDQKTDEQDTVRASNFDDGISAHLGAEWKLNNWLVLRGGAAYDSNTIPDATMARHQMDMHKITAALGGAFQITEAFILDVSYELLYGFPREVPNVIGEKIQETKIQRDTDQDQPGVQPRIGPAQMNATPGKYSMIFHSLSLGVRWSY